MTRESRQRVAIFCVALWLALAISAAVFGAETVYMTRRGQDIYKGSNGRVYETFACYVHAYNEKSIVSSGEIYFVESDQTCTIKKVH